MYYKTVYTRRVVNVKVNLRVDKLQLLLLRPETNLIAVNNDIILYTRTCRVHNIKQRTTDDKNIIEHCAGSIKQ